jgi:hypothetical protein
MTTESDLIRRYRGAFSHDECKKIIEYIDEFEKNKLLAYDKGSLHDVDHSTVNLSCQYDFPMSSKLSRDIIPNFEPCVEEYLETVSILKGCQFLIYDLKLKKIPMGGGFHSWHFENGSLAYMQRTFVIQLYLNDEFEGGETEFLYQNRREEAKAGDVLIFPCAFTHTHRGNPPIGGTKYLVTSWGLIQNAE